MNVIALLFEFSTLNGGERSMLAAFDFLRHQQSEFKFVAIAPPVGRLADALRDRHIKHVNWSTTDASGHRLDQEQIASSLCELVKSIHPCLLHANSLAMGRLAGRVAHQVEIPTTTHLRDIIKLSSAAIADLNRNRRLIAVSNATRDFHVAQGLNQERVVVVHNGIDLDQFQPRPRTGYLLEELQLTAPTESQPSNRPIKLIATIGQIGLRKGQDTLVAAAPAIIEKVPAAHFLLIGERTSQKAESIEFERAIQRGFDAAGLSDRLHLLGHRDDVARLLNEIDILVHPANQEPFGRVLLEASAAGVPIVATNVGGTCEIIDHGTTGYLIPPHDPQSLAESVIQVLTNEAAANQLSQAARAKTERQFSISLSTKRLAKVWRETLAG